MHYMWYSQMASEEPPITSNWPLRNRQLHAVIRRIKHWKQCLGAPMCYFGTNGPLLIYVLCVILPTGHWGTPHYSQPATEEWLHLTAIWGTWNTLNIENHLGGPWCVISGPIIISWCIMCNTPNRPVRNGPLFLPAIEEWLFLRAIWGTWNTVNVGNHLEGPRWAIFD